MAFSADQNELDAADGYFAGHLSGAEWDALAQETRRAALKTANRDIALLLGKTDADMVGNELEAAAVYEQAIFLARAGRGPAEELPLSESIDGIGSRTYRAKTQEERAYAPRALRLLDPLRAHGSLSRG